MPINPDLLFNIQSNHFREVELSLNEQQLTDEDILELVKALKVNTYVKRLNLGDNYISALGAQSLATLPQLEVLDISGNNIRPEGVLALAKSNLSKLDVEGIPIGDNIAVFAFMPSLIELHAVGCKITDIGAGQLFLSKSIKKLNLEMNKITGGFLENIISNTVLEELNLSRNNIQGKYCHYFAQNSTLKKLSLTSCFIKDEGAILLAKNCYLEELFLIECNIKDEGAIALSQNKSLRRLELFNNYITEIGAKAFINNTTLTYLSLTKNPFDLQKVEDLCKFYTKKRDKVFIRTQKDIEALLKKEKSNENCSINSTPAASMKSSNSSDESLGLLSPYTDAFTFFLESENIKNREEGKRISEALVENDEFINFFYTAEPSELEEFFENLEENAERFLQPPKKRKI